VSSMLWLYNFVCGKKLEILKKISTQNTASYAGKSQRFSWKSQFFPLKSHFHKIGQNRRK
jgi:hypothetical protein